MAVPGKEARPNLRVLKAAPVGRPVLSFALGAAASALLVPAFVLLDLGARWSPTPLVLTLSAVALISYFGALVVDRSVLLDATFVVGLVALAYLGPLPAACIWIGTEVVAFAFEKVRASAFLANVASYGWAVIAGGLLMAGLAGDPPLADAGAAAYAALALAGLVMQAVNFLVTRALVAVLRDGQSLGQTIRTELLPAGPATLAMTAIGVASALLYQQIGLLAFALFSLVALVPQLLLPLLLRQRPVAELEHAEAVSLYAQAIAAALGLDRRDRLVLKDAAPFIRERPLCPRDGELSDPSHLHRVSVVEAVLYYRERWDGMGGVPGAVGGEMIPLASRVLAVADAWSRLTAKGSPLVSHAQALIQLEARSGMHFDPRVVYAAIKVASQEGLSMPAQVAYQPIVHRLRLPRFARRLSGPISTLAGRAVA